MRRAISIFITVLLYSIAYADQPPCWCKFENESTNKKYVAIVDRAKKDSLLEPWDSEWTLRVFERTSKGNRLVWSIQYDYSGYPGGMLSDDGTTFIYVEYWYYSNIPLLSIYRQGKKVNTEGLRGIKFGIQNEKLVRTESHKLWLWNEGDAYAIKTNHKQLHLELRTVDGRIHDIDLSTGRLSSLNAK